MLKLWSTYTEQVLSWTTNANISSFSFVNDIQSRENVIRLLEHGERRQAEWHILLGASALGLDLANALKESLVNILMLESDVEKARAFLYHYKELPNNMYLLADMSPWALYCLTLAHTEKLRVDNSTMHWCMPPSKRSKALNTWRKLFLAAKPVHIPTQKAHDFKLSVGAIMHPSEEHLDEFFAQIPAWVHEVVIIWDGAIPKNDFFCKARVKHFSRALNADFSAQRNTMLKHCTGNWLIYLDADERLPKKNWEQLPYIACVGDIGVYFPRLTFEGDHEHVRMGHGLWPDVQLRFFPLSNHIHFVGSVHEKLAGFTGRLMLIPHVQILHYSHIFKDSNELRQRLATFSAAGNIEHKLSQAYPCLEKSFFDTLNRALPKYIFQLPS